MEKQHQSPIHQDQEGEGKLPPEVHPPLVTLAGREIQNTENQGIKFWSIFLTESNSYHIFYYFSSIITSLINLKTYQTFLKQN